MKAKKLLDVLKPLNDFVSFASGSLVTSQLSPLINNLEANKRLDLRIFVFLAEIDSWSNGAVSLNISQLLAKISEVQSGAGAKAASKSALVLKDDLKRRGSENASIVDFSNALEGFDVVSAFVAKLEHSRGNRDAFNDVVAKLQARGTVTKSQLNKIAHQYAGGPKTYKSNALAVSAIKAKFSSDQLFQSKTAS